MTPKIALTDKQMAILLATLTAIMPFSIDAYLPAIPNLAQDLNANIHHIEKSLSSFMFGVALGQLMGGSISDVKGRRSVALSGLAIYIVSSLALALLQSVEQLLFFRMIQAIGGGMAAVMAGAVVRDFYDGRQAAQMFALIGIIMMAAPLAAPMLGSILQSLGGWRTIFAFLMLYALMVFLLSWRFLPASQHIGTFNRHFIRDVFARYYKVLQTKTALGFLFFQAFSFGSMFVFLTESPFIYMQLYHLSPHTYAWVFGCNIITMGTFNRITAWRLKHGSNAENILLWGISIQLLANIAMLLFVYLDSQHLPPLALLVTCAMLSVGTQGLITANTQACFMHYFRAEGGSANALLMASTSLIGALMGWLATLLHNGTSFIMPSLMLAATLSGITLLILFSRNVWQQKQAN